MGAMGARFWLTIACIVAGLSRTECDLQSDILKAESRVSNVHNRSRRYVVFPEGSTFSVSLILFNVFCIFSKTLTE